MAGTTKQPNARAALLDRVIDDIALNGLGDRSLRDLAAAIGSSHRMLLYHFGSRDGLVAAIVVEVERRQRAVMTDVITDAMAGDDLRTVARTMWRRVSDPSLRPFVQLFFEVAAYASRLPADQAPGDLTQRWIDDTVRTAADGGHGVDPAEVRLGVAVVRGLLVDLVGGGDAPAVDAAFERYLDLADDRRR